MAKMDYEQAWKELKRTLIFARTEIVNNGELISEANLSRFRHYGEFVDIMNMAENRFVEEHLDEVIAELPEGGEE